MKKLALTLILLVAANSALAQVSECLPVSNSGSSIEIAAKAVLDSRKNTITVVLDTQETFTEYLVNANKITRGAKTISTDATMRTNLNVTVYPSKGQVYVLISPFMSMGIPQQLLCK